MDRVVFLLGHVAEVSTYGNTEDVTVQCHRCGAYTAFFHLPTQEFPPIAELAELPSFHPSEQDAFTFDTGVCRKCTEPGEIESMNYKVKR